MSTLTTKLLYINKFSPPHRFLQMSDLNNIIIDVNLSPNNYKIWSMSLLLVIT